MLLVCSIIVLSRRDPYHQSTSNQNNIPSYLSDNPVQSQRYSEGLPFGSLHHAELKWLDASHRLIRKGISPTTDAFNFTQIRCNTKCKAYLCFKSTHTAKPPDGWWDLPPDWRCILTKGSWLGVRFAWLLLGASPKDDRILFKVLSH